MATLDLSAVNDAGTTCSQIWTTGGLIDGLQTTDRVVIKEIVGTYTAWNAWGGGVNCSDNNGCPITTSQGWLNIFYACSSSGGSPVDYGSNTGGVPLVFPTAAIAISAWNTKYPDGITLTGSTSYRIAIPDPQPEDNVGGLSLQYTVFPLISNALMFSCNT